MTITTYAEPTELSRLFKRARAMRGWTLAKMSEHLGVSLSTLCCYERAEVKPKASNLKALAEKLGVPMGEMADAYAAAPIPVKFTPAPSGKGRRLPSLLVPAGGK